MLMHDLKWDGTWWHTTYWSKTQNRRVFVGRFKNKSVANNERKEAIKADK